MNYFGCIVISFLILFTIVFFGIMNYFKNNNEKQAYEKYTALGYIVEDIDNRGYQNFVKYEIETHEKNVKILNNKDIINGFLNGNISGNIFYMDGNINGSVKQENIIELLIEHEENVWKKRRINFDDILIKIDETITKPKIIIINNYKTSGIFLDGYGRSKRSLFKTEYKLLIPKLNVKFEEGDQNKVIN